MGRIWGPDAAKRRRSATRAETSSAARQPAETGPARRRLTVDETWRITAVSNEAAAWFGASGSETLIGLDARKLLPAQSPGFIAMASCLATREPTRSEFGSDFYPGRRVEAHFHPHGAGVEVSFWDVRERPARARAEPPRARQPRGAKTADDFEFTLDRDWQITSITKAAAAWCGSSVEDLLGRNGRDVNPAATTLLGVPIEAALRRGKTTVLEQPSTHVPGRWVKVKIAPSGDGVRIRFEDITANVPADDVGALGAGLDPAEIVLIDQRGIIVAANAAWRATVVAHGLELANAGIGARYADVGKAAVKDVNAAAFEKDLDDLLSGRSAQFEATYSIESPVGQEPRRVRVAPLRIGDATYFAAIHEDLTERAKILATLNETSDQLLHAQERERQRIAIELHDSMSQHLAGLMMGLAQLRLRAVADQRSQLMIDEMAKLTQLAIRETRVLSYLMNAAGDEEEGLELSVRRFVEGFGRRTGLGATFRGEGPLNAVGAVARHTLFRVTQEALSNVYRHAHATRVSVNLVSRADAVTVRIQDDGRGIRRATGVDAGATLLGVGIPGMRARIEQLGGNLEIGGGAAGGTTVTATIPLRSPRPALAATG